MIAQRPKWPEAYVQRARVRKRLGDKERAIADYAKAINIAPTAEMYLARALVWLELSQVKGAIAEMLRGYSTLTGIATFAQIAAVFCTARPNRPSGHP